MNKRQYEIIKLIESAPADKAKFLKRILDGASYGYDKAVKADAQRISGGLELLTITETACVYYGKKALSSQENFGGDLSTPIRHKLREKRTISQMDWSWLDRKTAI